MMAAVDAAAILLIGGSMEEVYKPAVEDLKPLFEQAIAGQDKGKWIDGFLRAAKTILLNTPLRYRAYGPYWWLLKNEYLKGDDLSFGDSMDQEWLSSLGYGETEWNLLAAFAYEEERITKNLVDDPFHTLETADGDDSVEYASNDPDMEMMGMQ